jgi:hypothetical protein
MKTSLLAATILSASLFSGVARAQESVLESLLTRMVSTAITVTSNEVQANVYESVVNTAYHFDLKGESKMGSVSVTDIASADTESVDEQDKDAE